MKVVMNPIQTFRVAGGNWRFEWICVDGLIDRQTVRNYARSTNISDIPFIAFGDLYLASINAKNHSDMCVRKVDRSLHIVEAAIEFSNYISLITVQHMEDGREMAVFRRSYMFNTRIRKDVTYYAFIGKDGTYEYRYDIMEMPSSIQYVYDEKLGPITTCQWYNVIERTNPCIPYIVSGDKLLMGTITGEERYMKIIEADRHTDNTRIICRLDDWDDLMVNYIGDNVVVICDHLMGSGKSIWLLYNLTDGTSYQIPEG
jgi:hypothetical protein